MKKINKLLITVLSVALMILMPACSQNNYDKVSTYPINHESSPLESITMDNLDLFKLHAPNYSKIAVNCYKLNNGTLENLSSNLSEKSDKENFIGIRNYLDMSYLDLYINGSKITVSLEDYFENSNLLHTTRLTEEQKINSEIPILVFHEGTNTFALDNFHSNENYDSNLKAVIITVSLK